MVNKSKVMPLEEFFSLIKELHGKPVTLLIRWELDDRITLLAAANSLNAISILLDHKDSSVPVDYVG